ncbi:MAG: 3-oxoadipate enol-lactonase [Methylovirgula sp.]
MPQVIVAGEPFNVVVEGDASAPAVVLSHALGANMHLFDRVAAPLKRHFRVVRYDTRGLGGSGVSRGPYSISQLGHDALAILDALKLERVDWIGHSEGGMVGLWLLTRAPERIVRAVLANTAAQIGGAEIWNERIRTVQEKGLEGLASSVLANWFTRRFREQHPEEVRRFEEILLATDPQGYAAHCAAIRDADLRVGLHAIKHPVLVVVGRHDPVTPPGVGALIASSIPSGRLVTLEAAHLSPVEAPDAFVEAAVAFLTGEAERTMETQQTIIGDDEDKLTTPEPMHEEFRPRPPRPPRPVQPRPEPSMPSASAPAPQPAPAAPAAPAPAPAPARPAPRKRPVKKAAAKKPVRKVAAKKAAAKKTRRKRVAKKIARKPARKMVRKTAAKKGARKSAKRSVKRPVKRPVKKVARKSGRRPGRRR